MIAYLFPGQGSQVLGMGKDLFPAFPAEIKQADAILGYSVAELCLNDPQQQLNQTQYTQPTLYVVNALTYFSRLNDGGVTPNYLAGHSLGEYNALLAAGVFDFETGLKLVKKRGELMGQSKGGGMAAVVGLNEQQVKKVLAENNLSHLSIANYNSYQQWVLTGPRASINDAKPIFEAIEGARYIPLKVSGAFHSPLMAEAQQTFSEFASHFTFNQAKIPVISNVTATPYPDNKAATLLAQQITHSVRWIDSIEYLLTQGVTVFEEIGPGRVLSSLVRRIRNKQ